MILYNVQQVILLWSSICTCMCARAREESERERMQKHAFVVFILLKYLTFTLRRVRLLSQRGMQRLAKMHKKKQIKSHTFVFLFRDVQK